MMMATHGYPTDRTSHQVHPHSQTQTMLTRLLAAEGFHSFIMTVDMHTYTNPEPRPDPVSQNRTQTRLVEPEPDPNPTVGKARLNPDPTFRTDPVGSIGSDHRPKPKTGSEPGFGQHYASTLDAGQDVRPDAAFLEPLDQVERCLWVFLSCILHSLSCACFGGKPGR